MRFLHMKASFFGLSVMLAAVASQQQQFQRPTQNGQQFRPRPPFQQRPPQNGGNQQQRPVQNGGNQQQPPLPQTPPVVGNEASQSTQAEIGAMCFVCGEGGQIMNPARFVSTAFGMYTCGGLAGAGEHGNVSEEECDMARAAAIEKCGCLNADGEEIVRDSDSQSGGQEQNGGQIQNGNQGQDQGQEEIEYCNICPNGGLVTIPDGIVSMPGGIPSRTCGQYLSSAVNGVLRAEQCNALQSFTDIPCGCTDPDELIFDLQRPEVSNETFVCPVCGEGMRSSMPDNLVQIPTQPVRTCSEFEEAAIDGQIPEEQCALVSSFVTASCFCEEGDMSEFVEMPQTNETFDCSICGEGNVVTLPDAIVTIPLQPNRSCADLLRANSIGNINEHQCALLQPFVEQHCGCTALEDTNKPTRQPTTSPPTSELVPTVSPAPTGWSTQRPECFDNLLDIFVLERDAEVTEYRRYILCPGTTFNLGSLDDNGHINEGDPFIMLRPNVMYQCGEDGSRRNNCILKGGDFGLASFYGIYEGIYETVDNVRIIGLTFQSQAMFGAVMEAAGDIQFIDCAFKEHGNLAPVLIQWKGDGPEAPEEVASERMLRSTSDFRPSLLFKERMNRQALSTDGLEATNSFQRRRLQDTEYKQVVTFRDCVFRDNYVTEKMGFPGVIENSFSSELNIENCLFKGNMFGFDSNPAPFGYGIRSYGPISVQSSCFLDNLFHAQGPISVFGAPHIANQNYVQSRNSDTNCEFLAKFSSRDDTTDLKPICFESDADVCAFSQPPTQAPTRAPRTSPSATSSKETSGTFSTSFATIFLSVTAMLLAVSY